MHVFCEEFCFVVAHRHCCFDPGSQKLPGGIHDQEGVVCVMCYVLCVMCLAKDLGRRATSALLLTLLGALASWWHHSKVFVLTCAHIMEQASLVCNEALIPCFSRSSFCGL